MSLSNEEAFQLLRDLSRQMEDNRRQLSDQVTELRKSFEVEIKQVRESFEERINSLEDKVTRHDFGFDTVKTVLSWGAGGSLLAVIWEFFTKSH